MQVPRQTTINRASPYDVTANGRDSMCMATSRLQQDSSRRATQQSLLASARAQRKVAEEQVLALAGRISSLKVEESKAARDTQAVRRRTEKVIKSE